MNHEERISYARSILDIELGEAIDLQFVGPDYWVEHFILVPGVDPLGIHKPYGLVRPQLVNDNWTVGVSIEHLLRPVSQLDDETFNVWLRYWVMHLVAHFAVMATAAENDEHLSFEEEERRVDEEIRIYGDGLYELWEHITSLQ